MKKLMLLVLASASVQAQVGAPQECGLDPAVLNKPDLKVGGHTLTCDAREVPAGHLNECGIMRVAAATYEDVPNLLKEEKQFKDTCTQIQSNCTHGKYTGAFFEVTVRKSADRLFELMPDPEVPDSLVLSAVCSRLAEVPQPDPPAPTAHILWDRLTLTRSVSDPHNKAQGKFAAPFMVSATHDIESDESNIGLYGTIGYAFQTKGSYALSATATIDSAAGQDREKSSVSMGLNWSRYLLPDEPSTAHNLHLRISQKYLTDRAFNREEHQLAAVASITSKRFLRAGLITCNNNWCDEENDWEFYWIPSIGVEAGRVNDAAGVPELIAIQEAGPYVRLVPSLSMSYRPIFWSPKLSFQLSYAHRYDVNEGWDRGLGAFGINYAIGKNAFWSLAWSKGRQEGSFVPVDTVLFGIGIQQAPRLR